MDEAKILTGRQRLTYIDIAKGILIILVVIGHVLKGSVFITKAMIRIINAFHMPAFFIISGLLTDETKLRSQDFWKYIKKRANRLLIPYVVFELLGGFWQMLLMGRSAVNITRIISGIFTVHCHVGADWFLIAMFLSEVLLYWIVKLKSNAWHFVVIILSFLIAFYLPELNWLMANIRRVAASFAFILIGMRGKEIFNYESKALLAFSVVGLVLGSSINTGTASIALRLFQSPILFVLCGIMGTYAVLYSSKRIANCKTPSKLLAQCGRASLVIMGTHQNVLIPFNVLLGNWTAFSIKFSILAITTIIEIPIVFICKKFLPTWVGEKRNTRLPEKWARI